MSSTSIILKTSLNKSPLIDTYSYGGLFTMGMKKLSLDFVKAGFMSFPGNSRNQLGGSERGQSTVCY